jgi:predicted house-cleaning noncanonical NTP pyrophosphatase (MazG superfamily)
MNAISKNYSNILHDNLVAYITKKHKKKLSEALKNDPNLDFEVISINEYIVLSPEMDHNINQSIYNFIDQSTSDLQGKTLEEIENYLQSDESKKLCEKYIPEIIFTITGVIGFTKKDRLFAGLIIKPYAHLYFIEYLNSFIELIIGGTNIPYKKGLFKVTNNNLMDYLGAILAAYLYVNPDKAFLENYDYTDIDLIERVKSSLEAFINYDQLQTSQDFALYATAFISEICSTSQTMADHIQPYAISQN